MSFNHTADMTVSIPHPFPKGSEPLPTPPSSPRTLSKELRRQTSRFRLPRILRRAQTSELYNGRVSVSVGGTGSSAASAFDGITNTLQTPRSPRAIQELTAAPSLVATQATPRNASQEDLLNGSTSRKLRKMPKSHHNLRSYMSERQLSSQLVTSTVGAPTLLPSPLLADVTVSKNQNPYFTFQNPRDRHESESEAIESSYDYENIVAGCCEEVFEDNLKQNEITSDTVADQQLSSQRKDLVRTPPRPNMSATLRSPQRDRSSSLSSEGTWLSKAFAHRDHSICIRQLERIKVNEKKLAEKTRRCCHLVQPSNDGLLNNSEGNHNAVR
jgi:hypothetical protein